MSSDQHPAHRVGPWDRLAQHREPMENSLLRGGLADVAHVIGASVSVGAAAACVAALVALLY